MMPPSSNLWPLPAGSRLAVLVSGGSDSAILVGEACRAGINVFPIYVITGLSWEEAELAHCRRFLDALLAKTLQPLKVLEQPVADVYGRHWSLTGDNVPDADTPDKAVFLPGRNVLLLAKAILWCHLQSIPAIALAPLESNPFPDATPRFFAEMEQVVNRAVEGNVRILRPYATLHKTDVLRRGQGMPLQHTFSCIRPIAGQHCGRCNKCAERQKAFADLNWIDPTEYISPPL